MRSRNRDKYFGHDLHSGHDWDQVGFGSGLADDDFMRAYGSDSFSPRNYSDYPLTSSELEPDLFNAFGEYDRDQ